MVSINYLTIDEGSIVANLSRYGCKFFGYPINSTPARISGEDLVAVILKDYLTEEPRFVESLGPVITSPNFDFEKLREKAIELEIPHLVHYLLLEYREAFKAKRKSRQLGIIEHALPLFKDYTRSLEEEVALLSPGRRDWILKSASPAARKCGAPAVYDQFSLRKKL